MDIWTFLLLAACTTHVRGYIAVTTASIGTMYVSVGIFSEVLTRNEATNRCKEYGFDSLENGGLNYIRYIGIVQKLQELTHIFTKTTELFWLDFFRLDDASSDWFESEFCWNSADRLRFTGNPPAGRNCAAVQFTDRFTRLEHQAIGCGKRLPFLCVKTGIELGPFKIYQESKPPEIPVGCTTGTINGVSTYEDCEFACAVIYNCVAVTFDFTTNSCLHMEIESDTTAWVTYSMAFKSQVQHGAKNGTLVKYYSASTTSMTQAIDGTLPDCGTVITTTSTTFNRPETITTTTSTPDTISTMTTTPGTTSTMTTTPDTISTTTTTPDTTSTTTTTPDTTSTMTTTPDTTSTTTSTPDTTSTTTTTPDTTSTTTTTPDTTITMTTTPDTTSTTTTTPDTTSTTTTTPDTTSTTTTTPDTTSTTTTTSDTTNTTTTTPDTTSTTTTTPDTTSTTTTTPDTTSTMTTTPDTTSTMTTTPDTTSTTTTTPDTTSTTTTTPDTTSTTTMTPDTTSTMTTTPDKTSTTTSTPDTTSTAITTTPDKTSTMTATPDTTSTTTSNTTSTTTATPDTTSTTTATPDKTSTTTTTHNTTSMTTTTTPDTPTGLATHTSPYFALTSTHSSTASKACKRKCPCQNSIQYNSTEMERVVHDIVRNLTINKAETSKTRREMTCAEDLRPSSKIVGSLGVAIISVVFVGIIILDLPKLVSLFS